MCTDSTSPGRCPKGHRFLMEHTPPTHAGSPRSPARAGVSARTPIPRNRVHRAARRACEMCTDRRHYCEGVRRTPISYGDRATRIGSTTNRCPTDTTTPSGHIRAHPPSSRTPYVHGYEKIGVLPDAPTAIHTPTHSHTQAAATRSTPLDDRPSHTTTHSDTTSPTALRARQPSLRRDYHPALPHSYATRRWPTAT